jgi:hypothetical protein
MSRRHFRYDSVHVEGKFERIVDSLQGKELQERTARSRTIQAMHFAGGQSILQWCM